MTNTAKITPTVIATVLLTLLSSLGLSVGQGVGVIVVVGIIVVVVVVVFGPGFVVRISVVFSVVRSAIVVGAGVVCSVVVAALVVGAGVVCSVVVAALVVRAGVVSSVVVAALVVGDGVVCVVGKILVVRICVVLSVIVSAIVVRGFLVKTGTSLIRPADMCNYEIFRDYCDWWRRHHDKGSTTVPTISTTLAPSSDDEEHLVKHRDSCVKIKLAGLLQLENTPSVRIKELGEISSQCGSDLAVVTFKKGVEERLDFFLKREESRLWGIERIRWNRHVANRTKVFYEASTSNFFQVSKANSYYSCKRVQSIVLSQQVVDANENKQDAILVLNRLELEAFVDQQLRDLSDFVGER
ncbi:hypothetical protein Ciccas_007650 [Cichlidogyrus casuarinus]|uniref:Uncharacterized protein n=1 Tax=Cichlidogyrus casuarinus TaxID=1844966 RepID=A0ABD2Q6C2_9PLAT